MHTAGSEQSSIAAYTVKWLSDDQFALLHDRVKKMLDAAGGSMNKAPFESSLLKWLVRQVAGTLNGHTHVTGVQLQHALAGDPDGAYEPWRPALMHALAVMEDADVLYVSSDGTQYVRCPELSLFSIATMAHCRRIGSLRVPVTG